MPTRPPIHRPPGFGAAARAHASRDRERLALRPNAAERGYDGEWRVVRKLHLLAHPNCVVPGCARVATDVDHVESIADAPHRRLDSTNLRSMCHEHHAQRTARDQGFARPGSVNAINGGPRGSAHPDWLGPSRVPLTIVCGPPGAGKSRYVEERAHHRDMVLDLDQIASLLTSRPLYHAPASALDAALRYRNQRLKLLSISRQWPSAWLVVSEPKAKWRAWWRAQVVPLRIVVIEEQDHVCRDRIYADERRPAHARAVHAEYVTTWWSQYTRLDDDIIIRTGHRPATGRGAQAS